MSIAIKSGPVPALEPRGSKIGTRGTREYSDAMRSLRVGQWFSAPIDSHKRLRSNAQWVNKTRASGVVRVRTGRGRKCVIVLCERRKGGAS